MLTEDDVVDAVMAYLSHRGWGVDSFAHAHQHGDDIVATSNGVTMRVEAKGEGSSKEGTRRFGQAFTRNQVSSHVAVAVTRALAWVSADDAMAALAFPDNTDHRGRVARIAPALHRLRIGIFWVDENKQVRVDAPWHIG